MSYRVFTIDVLFASGVTNDIEHGSVSVGNAKLR
jgi:hypothetical protein